MEKLNNKKVSLKHKLKMRLTALFMLASCLTMLANTSYTQTITLNAENASVLQIIEKIEITTEYRFIYNTKSVNLDRKVSIKVENAKIENVLSDLFRNSSTSFEILDTQIILKGKNQESAETITKSKTENIPQELSVSGNIVDANNQPLPGANILEKGTSNGTQSDFDGNFSLEISKASSTLVISYMGFVTQEIQVSSSQNISVTLQEDAAALDEVVIVGYGEIKKSDVTGSVVSIDSETINKLGATSPMQALQANAAGVNISQKTGTVGAGFDITIRGTNSFSQQQPLYVVDGIMTESIDFLNPQDIQRIDILKDASSTAIYGSRGSNGVVIVTTKTGEGFKNRKPSISYSGYVGIRDIANMPDFLNSYDESVTWQRDRQVARDLVQGNTIVNSPTYGFPEIILEDGTNYWEENLANRNGTDWLDAFLKSSTQQNHFISANGGNENTNYVVGFGYQGDNGNIKGQSFEKYNFKASVDAKVNNFFSIGANINLAFSEQELTSRQDYVQQLYRMPTFAPGFDLDGNIIQSPMIGISGNVSPYTFLNGNSAWNVEQYNIISNFYLKFNPIKGLTLKSTFSPNARIQREGEYKDRLATRSISIARFWTNNRLSYVWDNQLNYTKQFGDHNLSYDFIQSATFDRYENTYAYGRDVPFKSLFYNVQSAPQRDAATGFTKSTILSLTNRLNYSFKDKYLFTATMRYDGASRLAEGNKWTSFPSAAVAWKLDKESFFSNASNVNNLKARLSYGYTGSYGPIDPYDTQSSLSTQKYYDWDGQTANGFVPGSLANSDLTWERTREWNFGLDFGLFNNRVSGEINLYDRLSKDAILERKLAMPTGWASMLDNIASISNKGIEFQLKTVNINTQDFKWETNFIFSKNNNEIVDLYGGKEDDVPNRWFIGQPVNVVYAMVFDGVWQKDELAPEDLQSMEGTAKVKDLNGDGSIDINNDMKVLGSPAPDWIGTFSTTFSYKNWDLSATVYTKQGILTYSPFHTEFTDFNSKVILDVPYYRRDNPITGSRYSNSYPQASYQGQYWGEDAGAYGYPGFNKDASFVRVQNITLGYNFDSNALSKIGLSHLRLYVNALNPFTFTKYDGFDPEWAGAGMAWSADANNTGYSIYQLGVNIKF
ncbi:TonB-dependent receptor [Aestuariibaculum lutulentum]|uniref:TonB-dependent receptor n=1 Tax=Aestuariibaculum lutulentum TaxID=2920935 RepID=A0ABS9RFG5_9FLAO|nr:TonB-dependent receptor [Aestuariibaculum lutulentum]MCH4551684.1 TonB-dependent receptor [Aestuariibaculum lutulentum]